MYIFFCWGFIDACKQHQVQMDTFGSTAYKFMLIRMVGIKVLKVKWGHIVCLWNVKLKIPLRTFLEFSAKWSLSWILHCNRTRSISIWEFEFSAEKIRFQWWLLQKISKRWENMQSSVFLFFERVGRKICSICLYFYFTTVFFNMLTNVAKVWVNENTKERRRKLCSFMFLVEFYVFYQINEGNHWKPLLCFQKLA
jgi:hypothetical protein